MTLGAETQAGPRPEALCPVEMQIPLAAPESQTGPSAPPPFCNSTEGRGLFPELFPWAPIGRTPVSGPCK